jgi:hypothetical protein
MKISGMLSASLTTAVFALSMVGCSGEAAPLPEVRYFAIADT